MAQLPTECRPSLTFEGNSRHILDNLFLFLPGKGVQLSHPTEQLRSHRLRSFSMILKGVRERQLEGMKQQRGQIMTDQLGLGMFERNILQPLSRRHPLFP